MKVQGVRKAHQLPWVFQYAQVIYRSPRILVILGNARSEGQEVALRVKTKTLNLPSRLMVALHRHGDTTATPIDCKQMMSLHPRRGASPRSH